MPKSGSNKLGSFLIMGLGLTLTVFVAMIIYQLHFKDSNPFMLSTQVNQEQGKDPPAYPETDREKPLILMLSDSETLQTDTGPDTDLWIQRLNSDGIAEYTRGEYTRAADLFQRAYERDPENSTVRENLAHALGSLAWKQTDEENFHDALLNFESAIELKPDEPALFLGQGLVYHRLDNPDRAIESLKEAIGLDPESPEPYKLIGNIYYKQDDIEMAVGYFQKALELDPSNRTLQQQIAKAQRELKVQSHFQQQASMAFTVKFEGREERDTARQVLNNLEEAYREIGHALSYYPQQPVTVILYSNQQFRDVSRTPSWTKGLFDGKIRIPIGGAEQNLDLLKNVLFHEYSHAVVFGISRGRTVPRWLNEGIAGYFENLDNENRRRYPHEWIRSGQKLIPLSELHGSFMGFSDLQARMAYDESYAAVKELVDRYGLYSIQQLLNDLGSGIEFSEAFQNVFMVSYDTFQSEWQRQVEAAAQ